MESGKTSRANSLSLAYAQRSDMVFNVLKSSITGLTSDEVLKRRKKFGSNELQKKEPIPFYTKIFLQVRSPLTAVLVLAFIITLALDEHLDAIVISLALIIAVALGLYQEGRAGKAFEALVESQIKFIFVVRDGKRHEVNVVDLVPGDVVVLQGGMWVPADLRIIEAKNLSVNEAALTGEWLAVPKNSKEVPAETPLAERSSFSYMGTYVASGHGLGLVTETGARTEIGKLAESLSSIEDEKTPIQIQMARVSKVMMWVILLLVVCIFLVGILRGQGLEEMLLTSIAIAVASIPEGLPAAVTIVLAVGMEAVMKRGGLVRNLLAAETLGSTTYILTDKTGTLTEGKMGLDDMVYYNCTSGKNGKVCDIDNDAYARELLDIALCGTDAFFDEEDKTETKLVSKGDPVERSILETAYRFGVTTQGDTARGRRVDYLSFESENMFAAGLSTKGKAYQVCVNGSPALLLEHATKVFSEGKAVKLTKEVKKYFEHAISRETKKGKRLIAVAYAQKQTDTLPEEPKEILNNLTFGGLFILTDPVRSEVKQAVTDVKGAGVEVRLVTGDNAQTALTIAKEVGIAKDGDKALEGSQLEMMSDEVLLKHIKTTKVFARVLPNQKMRIVKVLQQNREIVAMTGDGINDAPALRKANIGVAIGSGTEVAKESSDLVLVNDSFATIRFAIEEGRRIVGNLRKIVGYLLSTSLAEAVLIGGAVLIGWPIPITAAQILWANIIEEGFMSVAFAFEKADKRAMQQKPQDVHKVGILNKEMFQFISIVSVVVGALLFVFYAVLKAMGLPFEEIRSMLFLAITIDSLFIAFSFRSLTVPVWKVPVFTNHYFIGALILNTVLLITVLSIPVFQNLLAYTPIPSSEIFIVLIYASLTMAVIEIAKYVYFKHKL